LLARGQPGAPEEHEALSPVASPCPTARRGRDVSADQLMWATAKQVLRIADSTDEPLDLSREERRQLGERLISHGWSYREISSALDVPTTTLHRWLAEDTDV